MSLQTSFCKNCAETEVAPRAPRICRSIESFILITASDTLTLVLDGDERVVMKPGDVVVQRGTIHAWVNETDEWARMYFVLLRKLFPREALLGC